MIRQLILVTLLGLFLQAVGVSAAGFTVSPVRVELSDKRNNTALSVTNAGEAEVVIQSELVLWSQTKGDDVYGKTDALIVNPPIFKIKPKATQVVRIGMRKGADSAQEQTFRLFLTELPGPVRTDEQGLKLTLRVGLPIFVLPPVKAAPAMQWKAVRTAADKLTLELRNTGNAHVQVKDLRLEAAGADKAGNSPVLVEKAMAIYVLAGQSRQWKFTVNSAWKGTTLHLIARTDAENVDMDMPLQAP